MMRPLYVAATMALLVIGGAGCSMSQTDDYPTRIAGSGSSAYAPGAGGAWDALPDSYHYRCTGQCQAF
jgi:hypothetical protein